MSYNTLKEACHAWVEGFNAIPDSVIEKLSKYDNSIREITPIAKGDRVYTTDPDWKWQEGEVIDTNYDGEDDLYVVKLDDEPDNPKIISADCIGVMHDYDFPMWGTMWSFGESIDEEWLTGKYCEPHLQEMANCGFRIFESEDLGVVFGIDGAGYDFYGTEEHPSHWINLYKARGLRWHEKG